MNRRKFLAIGGAAAGAALSRNLAQTAAVVPMSAEQPSPAPVGGNVLFEDTFSSFPAGPLTHPIGQLNGAIQEYHYLANRGVPLGPWDNAIAHMDAWVVSEEDDTPYLEQHVVNDLAAITNPILVTGDAEWSDYAAEVKMRPLSTAEMCGIVFRYETNRHYYLFSLIGGHTVRLVVRLPLEKQFKTAEWRELASAEFQYDTRRYYSLRVEVKGPAIRASIDGRSVLEANDSELAKGKVGVTANVPARFQAFRVTAAPVVKVQIAQRIRKRESELERLRAENPKPKLWRKFDTPVFGTGRSVRFGDLDGDGNLDMLFAQNIARVSGDGRDQISCLTAVNLEGKVLWQSGRPDRRNGLLTNDLPFQIHDIDGDGRNEIVAIRDFKIQVLEGSTGKVKYWAWMPAAKPPARGVRPPYALENGDAVAFLNVSGGSARRDIVIKDRYRNFWVLNNKLELLWQGEGQTGHFPFPFDIDGDGRDELFIGYACWDHDGTQLWSRDAEIKDHADAVFVGNFSAEVNAGPRVYVCGSDEGVVILSASGELLEHIRIGHAQSNSIAKYRPDLPGLQYMVINFWRNPGIVTLFDADGRILAQDEPMHAGSPLLPVNWRGDGQEFALLSGSTRDGGMIDGHLRRVVVFPEDGHPDLCATVADVTGDPRDEIILWDQDRVWIYTQDAPVDNSRVYSPQRNPTYNDSNYRTVISKPAWRTL